MERITFVTGNEGKVEEVRQFLPLTVDQESIDIPEIQSLDSEEIVRDKALKAFFALERPLLVEDVSLVFNALGKLPGPLIKYFEQELGNERLCSLVEGQDRSCTAIAQYGFHDGTNIHLFRDEMRGSIASAPRGTRSFGWASIFIPEGWDKTYAELSDKERHTVSYRRKAMKKFQELLRTLEA